MEPFFLKFDERVFLPVGPEEDPFPQLLQVGEMFHPGVVHHLKEHHPFQPFEDVGSEMRFALSEGLVDRPLYFAGQVFPRAVFLRFEFVFDPVSPLEPRAQAGIFPFFRMEFLRRPQVYLLFHRLHRHVLDALGDVFAFQDGIAQGVDGLALFVHDVVEIEELFPDVEVHRLHFALGVLDGLGDPRMLDVFPLLHAEFPHDVGDPFGPEQAHEFVREGQIEPGRAGVSLPARPAAELVVDPARFVPFRPQNVEPAELFDRFGFFGSAGVSAQHDVGSPAGHVGGDGHGPFPSRLADDLGFLLVIFGVEDLVRHPFAAEDPRQLFRFFDGSRSHQHRLAAFPMVLDLLHDGGVLLVLGPEDTVRVVLADHGPVGRYVQHVQFIDLPELLGFGEGGPGHARQFLVLAEKVLERDGGQGLVLLGDADVLLGFHRLVQPVGPAPARHEASGELVHDDDLAVFDHVFHVAMVELMRADGLRDVVDPFPLDVVVETLHVQKFFAFRDALVGQRDGLGLLVRDEIESDPQVDPFLFGVDLVLVRDETSFERRHHAAGQHIPLAGRFGGTGDDQRGAGFVDEDRIDFVDDSEIERSQHAFFFFPDEVVAQIVEPDLVVGDVSHIRRVGGLTEVVREVVLHEPHGQSEEFIDRSHPIAVAFGQIIVHGDDVDTAPGEGVEIDGKSGDEGLSLSGAHLRDLPLVEDDTADELNVKMAQADGPFGRFPDGGEGFGDQVIERFPVGEPFAELDGLVFEGVVCEGGIRRIQRVDLVNQGLELFKRAFGLRANEYL